MTVVTQPTPPMTGAAMQGTQLFPEAEAVTWPLHPQNRCGCRDGLDLGCPHPRNRYRCRNGQNPSHHQLEYWNGAGQAGAWPSPPEEQLWVQSAQSQVQQSYMRAKQVHSTQSQSLTLKHKTKSQCELAQKHSHQFLAENHNEQTWFTLQQKQFPKRPAKKHH